MTTKKKGGNRRLPQLEEEIGPQVARHERQEVGKLLRAYIEKKRRVSRRVVGP